MRMLGNSCDFEVDAVFYVTQNARAMHDVMPTQSKRLA